MSVYITPASSKGEPSDNKKSSMAFLHHCPAFIRTTMAKATLSYEQKRARLRYSPTWNSKVRDQLTSQTNQEGSAALLSGLAKRSLISGEWVLLQLLRGWWFNLRPRTKFAGPCTKKHCDECRLIAKRGRTRPTIRSFSYLDYWDPKLETIKELPEIEEALEALEANEQLSAVAKKVQITPPRHRYNVLKHWMPELRPIREEEEVEEEIETASVGARS